MNDLVSIVLTTLNGAKYIAQSIESCLSQTHRDIELIVVDGGSSDKTLEIVGGFDDPRIMLIHQESNAGKLPGALNLGLAAARGAYLTWTQDDCYYAPDAIEKMLRVLDSRPDVDQVYADWWLLQENCEPRHIRVPPPQELLRAKTDVVGVCFLMRRTVREVIGEHNVDSYPSQDYDYRMRIVREFQSERLLEPLYYYRLHEASLTGRLGWQLLARKDVETRLRLGLTDKREAKKDLADADIAEAFECYQIHRFEAVPSLVWSGIRRDPHYLFNRGVWSIAVKSQFQSRRAVNHPSRTSDLHEERLR